MGCSDERPAPKPSFACRGRRGLTGSDADDAVGTELGVDAVEQRLIRRLDVGEGEGQAQPVVILDGHAMEGQHVDVVHVSDATAPTG